VIVAVAKSFAALSQGGRVWPSGESFGAAIDVSGYSVEGFAEADATQLRVSDLFHYVPAAVLKARFTGAVKPARRLVRA
jgi:(1->4)-alpha-D-glucan 1-alpha-D-glucosylmutase